MDGEWLENEWMYPQSARDNEHFWRRMELPLWRTFEVGTHKRELQGLEPLFSINHFAPLLDKKSVIKPLFYWVTIPIWNADAHVKRITETSCFWEVAKKIRNENFWSNIRNKIWPKISTIKFSSKTGGPWPTGSAGKYFGKNFRSNFLSNLFSNLWSKFFYLEFFRNSLNGQYFCILLYTMWGTSGGHLTGSSQ